MFQRKSKTNTSEVRVAGLLIASVAIWLFAALINTNLLAAAGQSAEQPRSEAQQALQRILQNLKPLDTAYASGSTAEAQSKYDADHPAQAVPPTLL